MVEKVIYALKPHVPSRFWGWITSPYWWWYNRARHQLAAALSVDRKRSIEKLVALRDRHQGQRCFILGNGPSLKQTDLSRLNGEVSFGMNRIYLLRESTGFEPTYYVAVNTLVVEQCAGDILRLPMPKFISFRGRRWFERGADIIYLDTDYTDPPTFSGDVSGRVFEGSTVTYVAMQIAFHMGFEQVILVGVDHDFKTRGRPNVTVTSEGSDPDHFSPAYFGKGFRWQLPDLEASEEAYRMARKAFEGAGRTIVDATLGGKLEVFPKVDYDDLF